jgi:hypothetical protein
MNPRLAFLLLATGMAAASAGAAPQPPLPVSAHNCYPQDGQGADRLIRALALGIDNIEFDLGWDAEGRRLIVGHDARPQPGVSYPELEAYLLPALEAHWRKPRPDGAPTVLTIDWKTSQPEAVRRVHAFLEAHPDWFSSAPKAADSSLTPRRLTVCFTGEEAAKDFYDTLIPSGGEYRAFRDKVFGALLPYKDDLPTYVPAPATAYHRFLTVYWGHVERGGPPLAGEWTDAESARLASMVALAHEKGYRLRFYTLNGRSGKVGDSYRFPDEASARLRWRAAFLAGADWVASDDYELIAGEGAEHGPRRDSSAAGRTTP